MRDNGRSHPGGPRSNPVRILLPALLALLCVGAAEAAEVCERAVAYTFKMGKAERKLREEEAKVDARDDLARRVWDEAFRRYGRGAPKQASDSTIEILLVRYKVRELLAGGAYYFEGDKKNKRVAYCVPRDQYDQVKSHLRAQRDETVREVLDKFGELERLLEEGERETAGEVLTQLEIEVLNEGLEEVQYRDRSLELWLEDWTDRVEKGGHFVDSMLTRAEDLIEIGRLDEADRYVQAALETDRSSARGRELRNKIQDLRLERADLLDEAEKMASVGRFDDAQKRLERAEKIYSDDPLPLEATIKKIDGLRAAYLQYNPKRTMMIFTALNSLGADTGLVEQRVAEAIGRDVEATVPLNIGFGANFRCGRFMVLSTSLSFGASNDQSLGVGGQQPVLHTLMQLTGGVSYRTVRKPTRKIGFQFGGGVVWEQMDVDVNINQLKNSDSQFAFFVQAMIEWGQGAFFLRHGLGFNDIPDGALVGWSNKLQIGGAFVF